MSNEKEEKVGWEPLEPGRYRLDKEFHGGHVVTVLRSGRIFATVRDEDGMIWDTMANRLIKEDI